MKLVNFDHPVISSWFDLYGCRLDSKPYLSGSIEARAAFTKLDEKTAKLHEVTKGIFHPGREGRTYVDDPEYGVPFLGSTDILNVDLSSLPLLSKKQVAANPSFILEEECILITRSGTIGRMAFVRADMAGMACSEDVLRVAPDPDKILPGYLYAYLSSKFGLPQVVEGTYGAIIQHIEPLHIADLLVPYLGKDVETSTHNLITQASALRTKALNILHLSGKELLKAVGLVELPKSYKVSRPLISVISSQDFKSRLEGAFHSPLALDAERKIVQAQCEVLPLAACRREAEARLLKMVY